MYWAYKGNIFSSLKNSLRESLFLAPIIILIARFCNLNTHLLLVEYPPKNQTIGPLSEKKHNTPFLVQCWINTISIF
jgi:hypothetical protein